MHSIHQLDTNLSKKLGPETIKLFKDLVFKLKSQINSINLDLNRPMNEKIELYTLIYVPLNQLTNKYQMKYRKFSNHQLYVFNFIELKILEYFVLWSSVNNSSNQYKFYHQISANLLAKILELDSFNVSFNPVNLEDVETLNQFGQQFNYHQISAGLYTSALSYLDRIHIEDAKKWAREAFIHYSFLFNLLVGLDYNQLYIITKNDKNRDFYQLLEIFIWPMLDYVKFIHTIYLYFGEDWVELSFERNIINHHQLLSKNLEKLLQYFDEIKSQVLAIPQISEDTINHSSWYNYESIQMILRGKLKQIEMIELQISQSPTEAITDEFILDQLQYLSKIAMLMDNTSQTTLVSYHTFLATENLIIILLQYYQGSNYEILPYLDLISNFLETNSTSKVDHGLILLYFIAKYNHLVKQEEFKDIYSLIVEIKHVLDEITTETADSLLLRILIQLVENGRDEDKIPKLRTNLVRIKEDLVPKSIHFHIEFEEYLDFLIGKIDNKEVNFPSLPMLENKWDWRTWLIPNLNLCKRDFVYFPINHKSLIIDYEAKLSHT